MNEKSKIVTIYVVVALVSVLILAIAFYLRSQQVKPAVEPYYTQDVDLLKPMLTLEKDLALKNQNGDTVQLDLAAQCRSRNSEHSCCFHLITAGVAQDASDDLALHGRLCFVVKSLRASAKTLRHELFPEIGR